MGKIFSWSIEENRHLTIVVFDSLRILTNLLKGRDIFKAKQLARQSAGDLCRMVSSVFKDRFDLMDLKLSSDLMRDLDVLVCKENVRRWVLSDNDAFDFSVWRTDRFFRQFGLNDTQLHKAIQFEYMIEETAVSLSFISRKSISFELYPKKEEGLIDRLFRSDPLFFENRSLLAEGRKFKTWNDIGVEVD